jgi:PAS domain S-box-containing protein
MYSPNHILDATAYRLFAQQTSDVLFEYTLPFPQSEEAKHHLFLQIPASLTMHDPDAFERLFGHESRRYTDILDALRNTLDDEELSSAEDIWYSAVEHGFATRTFRILDEQMTMHHWQVHVLATATPADVPHTLHILCSVNNVSDRINASLRSASVASILHPSFTSSGVSMSYKHDYQRERFEHTAEHDELDRQTLELQMVRERYRFLAENMSDLIVLRDIRTRIVLYVSPSVKRVLGYTPEEYNTASVAGALVHPDDRTVAVSALEDINLNEHNEGTVNTRLRHADGHYVWLESRVRLLTNDRGVPFATISSSRDITQRIETEQSLKKSEQLYRLLSDNMMDTIMLYNEQFQLLYVSPSVESVLGYSVEEYTALSDGSIIHPDDVEGITTTLQTLSLQADTCMIYRYRVLHKHGKYIWIEARVRRLHSENNAILSIWQLRDITLHILSEEAKKQAQEDTEQALAHEKKVNELRTHFMTMASHQFRTPLTVIRSNADLLAISLQTLRSLYHTHAQPEHTARSEKTLVSVARSIDHIYNETDRIVDMLDDIALLADVESHLVEYTPELRDILSFVKERALVHSTRANRSITVEHCQGHYLICFDAYLMQHIIDNVVSNALKYSQGAPPPVIRLESFDELIRIHVQDFGIGIPESDQKNMFQNFGRAQNVLNIQGAGLGLVLTQEFLRMHGGTISFESHTAEHIAMPSGQIETTGTTFTMTLPRT